MDNSSASKMKPFHRDFSDVDLLLFVQVMTVYTVTLYSLPKQMKIICVSVLAECLGVLILQCKNTFSLTTDTH